MCTNAEGENLARIFGKYWKWQIVKDEDLDDLRRMSNLFGARFAKKDGEIYACTDPDSNLAGATYY